MGIFESTERPPVTYLPTGDHALVIAWVLAAVPSDPPQDPEPLAILCLEDGSAIRASVSEFKFDYRYSTREQKWFDVSRIEEVDPEEDPVDADTDQEDADDGSPEVP